MNEMPFCTQLSLQLQTVNDALDPVLTQDQRIEVEAVVEIFKHQLEGVDHSVGATAVLRIASELLEQIVGTPRLAS